MRLALVVSLMLVPVLAGCASVKDAAESAAESAGIALPSSSSAASSSGKANLPPTADLTANLVNGTAPLNVTFTLAGADPEGKPITWDFAVGNLTQKGTTLPATVNATLAAGNLTARLIVSDGALNTTRTLNVTVAAASAVVAFVPQSFTVSGSIVFGTQGVDSCGVTGEEVARHDWIITGEAGAVVTLITVHADLGASNLDSDIYLYDAAGTLLGSGTNFNFLDGPTEDFTVDGPLAPGTYTFEVLACTGVNMEYTIEATAA